MIIHKIQWYIKLSDFSSKKICITVLLTLLFLSSLISKSFGRGLMVDRLKAILMELLKDAQVMLLEAVFLEEVMVNTLGISSLMLMLINPFMRRLWVLFWIYKSHGLEIIDICG